MQEPNLKLQSTTPPDKPIEDFNLWQQYISLQQEDKSEIRRFKEQTEQSFVVLHNSIMSEYPFK